MPLHVFNDTNWQLGALRVICHNLSSSHKDNKKFVEQTQVLVSIYFYVNMLLKLKAFSLFYPLPKFLGGATAKSR